MLKIHERTPKVEKDIEEQQPFEAVVYCSDGEALPKRAERRVKGMEAVRDNFIPVWREIQKFITPHRGLFDCDEPNQGLRKDQYLLDSTPQMAINFLQSGIQGGLTSPSLDWFRLAVDDTRLNRDVQVRQWADDCREVLMDAFSRSNIYNTLFGVYGEVSAFGTAAMLLEDDVKAGKIHSKIFTAGQYCAAFGLDGLPSAFAYKIWMTAEQIDGKFGRDRLDEQVLQALRNKRRDMQFEVWHLIYKGGDLGVDEVTDMPYTSIYWRPGKEQALLIGGFNESPMFVPRWDTIGEDTYGYGPGWNALGDSKMLQEMVRDYLVAQKMMIRPPLFASTQARELRVNLNPGGVSYADSDVGYKPIYQIAPDLQGQLVVIQATQQKIREAFFSNLFLLNTGETRTNMTAYEVEQRQREKLQMLGPVLERLDNELLDPMIGRAFNICERSGLIPPAPETLVGSRVNVEYVSPLAIAQKASSTASLTSLLQLVGGMAQMAPEVLDNVDSDKMLSEYMRMTGVPAAVIRPDRAIAKLRAERQAQQQQAMQAQEQAMQVQMGSEVAGAAKDLANAPTQGNSLLDTLMGGGSPGQRTPEGMGL